MKKLYNDIPSLLCDFYKVDHRNQYPKGTQKVYSTWVPRGSRIAGVNKVVAFGFQYFIIKYLIRFFGYNFFCRNKEDVIAEYKRYIQYTLGVENPDASHIEALHNLGYLPVRIRAVKEGTLVPLRVPMLTVENTHDDFFWVTNYLETLMSCELWMPSTSATIAYEYKRRLMHYAEESGGSLDFVPFQGHDFSMRGMGSLESAKASGAGHLLSFVGTDTVPAIMLHEQYYNADIEKELVGTSIPATEHSVMCAGGQDDELETYRRLIEDIYPNGFVSIVSDTWDFWHVVGDTLLKLKDKIMARDGRVVIRPDSGDPVKIIVGDPEATDPLVRKGLIECLWDTFGGTVNEKGFKELDSHIGAIYGDSITLERCEKICEGLIAKGFASTNIVFGIGSYTYQYQTRDTFMFAMKATHVVINGEEKSIMKDPKTDSGMKKSNTGRVWVHYNHNGEIVCTDGLGLNDYIKTPNLLEPIFEDGKLLRNQSLSEIRNILATQ